MNPRVQRDVLIILFTPMRLDYCRPKIYMIFMFHELCYRSQHQTLCDVSYQCQFQIFICIYNIYLFIYLFIYNIRHEARQSPILTSNKSKGCPNTPNKIKGDRQKNEKEWNKGNNKNKTGQDRTDNSYSRWEWTAVLKDAKDLLWTTTSGR